MDNPHVRLDAGLPADREGADDRGVVVPAQPRPAVRLPGQRPRLHRELPLDDVQDRRAALRAGSRDRPGARGAVHPPRRPRAELLGERDARDRVEQGRPVLGARRRGGRSVRPAARRGERGSAEDARRDRRREAHPGLRRAGEGRRVQADGLRPPGLQELRPAREDHQARRPTRCSRSRAATRCSTSRSSWRRSRSRTSTSSAASCTRTSTSTRGSSTRRSGCRWRCSRSCSRSRGRPAGSPSGSSCCDDPEQKIARPRQLFVGAEERDYMPIARRKAAGDLVGAV